MEDLIQTFLETVRTDKHAAISMLEEFCDANQTNFSFGHIAPLTRCKFARCLIHELCNGEDNTATDSSTDIFIAKCLEALRLLSRDSSNLAEMVSEDSCQIFLKLAGLFSVVNNNGERELNMDIDTVINKKIVVVEALKCICNLIFQDSGFRQLSTKYNCTEAVCLRCMSFNYSPRDVSFFDFRLLFVVTALEAHERTVALHSNAVELLTSALDEVIPGKELRNAQLVLELQVKETSSESTLPIRCNLPDISLDKGEIELLGEILKVIFNITIIIDQKEPGDSVKHSCDTLIFVLRQLLIKCTQLPHEPKQLQNNIINTLINLPYQCYELLYWEIPKKQAKDTRKKFEAKRSLSEHPIVFESFNVEAICILLGILDKRLIENIALKETLTPLLSVLTAISRQNRVIRKYLRQEVLPPLGYVGTMKPEEEKTTRGRLVKHLTSAVHEVKESVADFLFVLCKESVGRLIKYTGYGNAAGFLSDHGLMAGNKDGITGNYSTDDEDSDTEEYERIKDQIDPMTGAQIEEQVDNPLDKMTEEEKEEEAEKLAKLLSKLNEKGVVKTAGIGRDGKATEMTGCEEDM